MKTRGLIHDKLKVCIAGAADASFCGLTAMDQAKLLGREVIRHGGVLVVGAVGGFPSWSAMGAKEVGGLVIGFSPAANEEEHVHDLGLPTDYFDHIVYTDFGHSGANVLLARSADAVIIGCGRVGTINEFTIAYEDRKPIGILKGEWKTDEMIEHIIENGDLETDKIIISSDPKQLIVDLKKLVNKDRTKLDMRLRSDT